VFCPNWIWSGVSFVRARLASAFGSGVVV